MELTLDRAELALVTADQTPAQTTATPLGSRHSSRVIATARRYYRQ
jgi:hypothetical protein